MPTPADLLARLGLQLSPDGASVTVQAGDPNLHTAPLEGWTLEAYATIQARRDHGDVDPEAILAEAGIDAATWARVIEAWSEAMSRDTSHALTIAYGRWYAAALDPTHPALCDDADG